MAAAVGRIEPIDRVPTASLIADQLREAIMSGALAQGTQLGEADLASRFGVSRGPLREAMQRLVQEGLLESVRHRGLFVVELTADDIRDMYAARYAVEAAAAERIFAADPDHSATVLARPSQRMSAAARRGDAAALSQADLAFHEALVAESGSPRLQRMASTLLVETRMCMSALPRRYRAPGDMASEHADIVAALRDRRRDKALLLLDAHMQDAVDRLTPPAP